MPELSERHDLRAALAQRGVRLTRQRQVLVDVIQNATRHLDAETLWRHAQRHDASINLATVYRTLGLLKRMGLVDELDLMHLEGEKHYYEVSRTRTHLHLACFRCGSIEEFQTEAFERLRELAERACGFSIQVGRLEFGGLCRDCRQRGDASASGGHVQGPAPTASGMRGEAAPGREPAKLTRVREWGRRGPRSGARESGALGKAAPGREPTKGLRP